MFKMEASKIVRGNYLVAATCSKGHTVFKDQMHLDKPYKCPYVECGHANVP